MLTFVSFVILTFLVGIFLWWEMPVFAAIGVGAILLLVGRIVRQALPNNALRRLAGIASALLFVFVGLALFARLGGRSIEAEWRSSNGWYGLFTGQATLGLLLPLTLIAIVLYLYSRYRTMRSVGTTIENSFTRLYGWRKALAVPLVTLFALLVASMIFQMNVFAMYEAARTEGAGALFTGNPPDALKLLLVLVPSWVLAVRYVYRSSFATFGRNFAMPFLLVLGLSMVFFGEQAAWLLELERANGVALMGNLWVQRIFGVLLVIGVVFWAWWVDRVPLQARPVLTALDARNIVEQAALSYGRSPEESRSIAMAAVPLPIVVPPIPGTAQTAPETVPPVAAAAPAAEARVAPAPRVARRRIETRHRFNWNIVWTALAAILVLAIGAGLYYAVSRMPVAIASASPAAATDDPVVMKTIALRGSGVKNRTPLYDLGQICLGYARATWTGSEGIEVFTTDNLNHGVPANSEVTTKDDLVAFAGPVGKMVAITCHKNPKP